MCIDTILISPISYTKQINGNTMNIYVGNLPWSIRDEELENLFAEHGTVESAKVITERHTNR